jgi:hypothetical protein
MFLLDVHDEVKEAVAVAVARGLCHCAVVTGRVVSLDLHL